MAVSRFTKSGMSGYSTKFTTAWTASAIGGTITTAGGYRIHTFTTVGDGVFTVVANLYNVEYLLIAGGGGAAGATGGKKSSSKTSRIKHSVIMDEGDEINVDDI